MNNTQGTTSVTTLTVGDLRRLLRDKPDNARLGVCLDSNDGWVSALNPKLLRVLEDNTTFVLSLGQETLYEDEVALDRA